MILLKMYVTMCIIKTIEKILFQSSFYSYFLLDLFYVCARDLFSNDALTFSVYCNVIGIIFPLCSSRLVQNN